jgi:hypothetical protein
MVQGQGNLINPNRNKFVLFTMKWKAERFAEPTLLNTELHTTRSVNYPWVILDVKLSWRKQDQ